MCSPFSCSSFKSWKEYDFDEFPAPIKTPQKSKSCRSSSFSTKIKDEIKKKDKKNPYANQGLDKFAALLAELEAKKQKIYMQKGSGDISLVYFTYTNSDELQPFIVKVKKQQQQQQQQKRKKPNSKDLIVSNKEKEKRTTVNKKDSIVEEESRKQKKELSQIRKSGRKSFKKTRNGDQSHIFRLLPVTIILILVLLCLSGRSFAIICVTVVWYLVPMLSREKL